MSTKVKSALQSARPAIVVTLALLVICGLAYPLALTGISQVLFPHQANGSIIEVDGKAVGAEFVGQDFTDPRFMKCRPSAVGYNTYTEEDKASGAYGGVSSGSKNYAATNPDLVKRVEEDIASFLEANPNVKKEDIPTDLLTASGSGLDPHVSPASAAVQIPQLAVNSGLSVEALEKIVAENTTGKVLGVFGEVTVNVLAVNLDIAAALA